MSFFLLSWGKVILERMSFGLWIVSYFVTFKVQATAVKLQSVATPVLHESPMPAPATGSDGLTLCRYPIGRPMCGGSPGSPGSTLVFSFASFVDLAAAGMLLMAPVIRDASRRS